MSKKIILAQFIILLLGTLFAWFNFFNELVSWLKTNSCTISCSAGATNPFLAPCFYGAIFFTVALVLSAVILKQNK